MKPINVARFVQVFSVIATCTLLINIKLGNLDDHMWVAPVVSLALLASLIISTELIETYQQEQQ